RCFQKHPTDNQMISMRNFLLNLNLWVHRAGKKLSLVIQSREPKYQSCDNPYPRQLHLKNTFSNLANDYQDPQKNGSFQQFAVLFQFFQPFLANVKNVDKASFGY